MSAAALRSISVLVRRSPRAALHVAGAGILQAGKAGIEEATQLFKGDKSEPVANQDDKDSSVRPPLEREEKFFDPS